MTKEELEKEIKNYIDKNCEQWETDGLIVDDIVRIAVLDFAEPKEKWIADLEEEVKEWKDKADLWCKTANLKDHNIMINKELEKENADLKEEINKIAFARGNLEEENAELKEELKKWKDEWQEQVQKATDEGYARTLQTVQLTKAVEIIKTLADDLSMYSGNYQKELLEAKQFLSEVEKGKGGKDVL